MMMLQGLEIHTQRQLPVEKKKSPSFPLKKLKKGEQVKFPVWRRKGIIQIEEKQ